MEADIPLRFFTSTIVRSWVWENSGPFDDSGAMPSCIVNRGGQKYLYYIGWNRGVTVPSRNSIGLAISDDGGLTFERAYEGPVATEPCSSRILRVAVCALRRGGDESGSFGMHPAPAGPLSMVNPNRFIKSSTPKVRMACIG